MGGREVAGGSGDGGRWFTPLADHMQAAYLRYSFTKGTEQEVDFLVEALALAPGDRVLDVGCGPGRHVRALRNRGIEAIGLDLAESFCSLVVRGDPSAPAIVADVRCLPVAPAFDAVISLCQGGFGLLGGPGAPVDADAGAFAQLAGCLRPGGRLALSAFSSYFQVRHQIGEGGEFDADTSVVHERTVVKDETGADLAAELWTTGFTPRELRLLAAGAGLAVEAVWSVEPGDYAARAPVVDFPEFLLVAQRRRR